RVALKVIRAGMDTREVIARFSAERQALALMDHPGIAKVLDAGATATGRPYFVMELVRGIKITEYCDQAQLPAAQRLRLFIQVCQAVQHAHQKGIIHRDLKPSNVLVTLHDGVPVPKVIDFGIAKATTDQPLTDKTVFTAFEQFLGTPAYMSPEQAELSGLDIDTRSDIYSLGVLLYELLTGSTPFDTQALTRAGLDEIRKIIREQDPPRPSTKLSQTLVAADVSPLQSSRQKPATEEEVRADSRRLLRIKETIALLRGDLDWIVMKCLEKDRTRRYSTANGLAADLHRYLNDEPVVARPPSAAYRIQKTFRRHRLAFASAAAVLFSLVIGLFASLWQTMKLSQAQHATQQAQEATQRQAYVSKMREARQAWDDNNLARLRELLEETAAEPDRGFEWYYWQRQAHLELRTLRGHLGQVVDVAFSPDGERVLTASLDATARLWDSSRGTALLKLAGHRGAVTAASWSPDGRRIVTAGADGTARIWDAASGTQLLKLKGHSRGLTSARFSPDGQRIVTGSLDRTARVWRADTGDKVLSLTCDDAVYSVAFSSDGQRIVTGSADEKATVWDAATGEKSLVIQPPSARIPARAGDPTTFYAGFAPDGNSIVTASQNQLVNLWDATTGAWLFELKGKPHWLSPRQNDLPLTASFSPDAQRLIVGGLDFAANVWQLDGQTNLFTLKGHEAEIVSTAFSADGRFIVTGSYDHTAKIWSGAGTTESLSLDRHTKVVSGAAFSPDGGQIVTASWDGTAIVWAAATGERLFRLDHGTNAVWRVAFSPEGTRILSGAKDGTFRIWDAFSGQELLKVQGHTREIYTAEFSQDGRRMLTAAADSTAKLWDASTGRELHRFDHNQLSVMAAFSPDGRRIATVCNDNNRNTLEDATAAVWDAETGRKLFPLEGHLNGFSCVAFSPDGRFIVTGSIDWTATAWDASSGKERFPLKGHHAQVIHVAVSPDSRRIFTGGFDNTTRVWDAASGEELLTLKGGLILAPGISADGRRIVAGPHPPVTVWESATPQQVANWHEEERRAKERVGAERREREAIEERNRALGIKQWLVLAPLPFEGTNGATVLDQALIPEEANLHPREGQRVRIGLNERLWTAVRQDDLRLDFQELPRQANQDHQYRAAYAVCYIASETAHRSLTMYAGTNPSPSLRLPKPE
ncbi:MAG: serine/threonine protein kinase, partial [Verrucomicrobia bacterium]|nr:serine/threonine protein kinase [Verrucomicrobiota bacterium]